MDRQTHVAYWLRMLARNEIRLARASFSIFKTSALQLSDVFSKNGQAAAEESLLHSQDQFYQALAIGYTHTTKQLISYTFEQLNYGQKSTFQEIVQGFIQTQALEKSRLIIGTTKEIVRAVILRGQQQGIGNEEIASNIRTAVSDVAPLRSRTIARTETHNAATYGMQTAAEETEEKLIREWVCVSDERTREEHEDADGQQREMDEDFDVGGEYIDRPGEGSAENSINCRCTLIYIPKEF